uniref:Uncharacterized protein n=1 Tax=Canis lupus dingo TaxID=286419 RepID=A0A8C0JZT8_CANLU
MNSTLVKITEIEANQDGSDSKEQGHSTPPGLLKACLANLHRELIIPKGGGGGGPGEGFDVAQTDDARIGYQPWEHREIENSQSFSLRLNFL